MKRKMPLPRVSDCLCLLSNSGSGEELSNDSSVRSDGAKHLGVIAAEHTSWSRWTPEGVEALLTGPRPSLV